MPRNIISTRFRRFAAFGTEREKLFMSSHIWMQRGFSFKRLSLFLHLLAFYGIEHRKVTSNWASRKTLFRLKCLFLKSSLLFFGKNFLRKASCEWSKYWFNIKMFEASCLLSSTMHQRSRNEALVDVLSRNILTWFSVCLLSRSTHSKRKFMLGS